MDNKLKIVNYLGKSMHKRFTMHELSKILKIPYASFYRTVKDMIELLVIEDVGKSKTISLNLENKVVKSYLSISSEEEKKEFLKKQHTIRMLEKDLETDDIVILFGSYAKKEESERSDIDIMILNKDGKKSVSFSKFEMLFKKDVNPMFFTKKEFQLMLKEKEENVGKQALKNNIILKNPEKFWEVVLNAV